MRTLVLIFGVLFLTNAWGQSQTGQSNGIARGCIDRVLCPPSAYVVPSCGELPSTFPAGSLGPLTMDTTGKLCVGSAGSPSGNPGVGRDRGIVVASCGTPPQTYHAGQVMALTTDEHGDLCTSGSGGGGGGGTACTNGATDLSLTTGCNIFFYVAGVFP